MCSQFFRTKLFKYDIHNPILPLILFTFSKSGCLLSCPLGYEPNTTCSSCNPVHVCVTNNPCQNEGTCNIGSSSTSYTCSCLPNYSGQTCEGKYIYLSHITHLDSYWPLQGVFSRVLLGMNKTLLVVHVSRCTFVSLTTPVGMEEHATLETMATMPTPVCVLFLSWEETAVSHVNI